MRWLIGIPSLIWKLYIGVVFFITAIIFYPIIFPFHKPHVMVCRSGARSGQACMHLLGNGFDKVYNLQGGMMMWTGDVE